MDNFRCPDDFVVIGNGDVLYVGRIHPHPAHSGDRIRANPRHPGSIASLERQRPLRLAEGPFFFLDFALVSLPSSAFHPSRFHACFRFPRSTLLFA